MIYCPRCSVPVADHTASGRSGGVCPKCRYRYGSLSGTITHRFVKQIVVGRQTGTRPGRYKQAYEFRLKRPDGASGVVEFQIGGSEDRINLWEGDAATVLYSMKGETFNRIVSVVNDTTMTSFDVARPGGKERTTALVLSMIVAGASIVAGAQFGMTLGVTLLIALGTGASSFYAVSHLISSRAGKRSPEAVRARGNAEFFAKKEQLLALRDEHLLSGRNNEELRTRLLSLRDKMRSVGDELYASRLEQAQDAINLLDRVITLDAATLEQYSKSITMIEIEQESLSVSDAITTETAGLIEERMATLDEVRRQNAELHRQLEANEEVQRLLG
jgi:hypothetical protein